MEFCKIGIIKSGFGIFDLSGYENIDIVIQRFRGGRPSGQTQQCKKVNGEQCVVVSLQKKKCVVAGIMEVLVN